MGARNMSTFIKPEYRNQFIKLMNDEYNPKCVYPIETIAESLRACGVDAVADAGSDCLRVGETEIHLSNVEWGVRGVSPLKVLCSVIDAHGFDINSRMTGTGFLYRDLLEKLAARWGISES